MSVLANQQSEYVSPRNVPDSEATLIREIREDYRYFLDFWRDIREEGGKDIQYVKGDPWPANDKREREAAGRPALVTDELGQYLGQANNNLRQNKRAVQVNPKGAGATDKDAERRAAIIRGIEYQSNAQAAYTTGFEQCTESSFGVWRIVNEYVNQANDDTEPRIKRIANQFTVLFDPNAKEADRSDQNRCFVTDKLRTSEFAERFPDARKVSFDEGDRTSASDWFQGENIVIAEYWKRTKVKSEKKTTKGRSLDKYKVTQYITNGLEILETNEWPGSWIPIIGVFGKEFYTFDGGQSRLIMMSMIRKARDPQMMLNYLASQQAEEAGMSPRTPFTGYEGEFSGADAESWKTANKIPRSTLTITMPTWWKETWGPPPLPGRLPFIPNFQGYEQAMEGWRRRTQASMGQSPLPTSAQRQNEKSGIALEKIQTQLAIGAFNFTDNFDRSLMNTGRQLNELIDVTMDTPRYVSSRGKDDTHSLMAVMQQEHLDQGQTPEGLDLDKDDYLITGRGEYDVTISTGPNSDSQRDEAGKFLDNLISNLQQLPPPGSPPAKILALAIKLKALGPIGDEIADVLDPEQEEDIPPQAKLAIQKMQQENQALNAYAQQKEAENQKLEFEKQAKILDNQQKLDIEKLKIEAQIATAEINTKAQSQSEREAFVQDIAKQVMDQLHQQQMTQMQQGHEVATQAADQAHEADQTASQQQHEQGLADQQAANAQNQQMAQIAADQQAQQQQQLQS
jgi:hypothetical protein